MVPTEKETFIKAEHTSNTVKGACPQSPMTRLHSQIHPAMEGTEEEPAFSPCLFFATLYICFSHPLDLLPPSMTESQFCVRELLLPQGIKSLGNQVSSTIFS